MLWSYFTDRGHICHGWGVITKWQITFNHQFFRNSLHSYDEPWGKKALTVMMPLWGFNHGFRTFIRETQDRRYSYWLWIARTFCFFFSKWLRISITGRCFCYCTQYEVSVKDFFIKCEQVRRKLRIYSHLLKET